MGCAAPEAAVTTEKTGAQTAAIIAGRSSFDMLTSCPELNLFKPADAPISARCQLTMMRSFSQPRTVEVGASCAVS
jgi:hypothetical protein